MNAKSIPAAGSTSLAGFVPRTGEHCESSALLNALAHLGYGLTEADIVGGAGAPAFLFTNEAFPFIGGRRRDLRESFLDAAAIPYGVARPAGGRVEWEPVFELLGRGLPVLLRVDMRWLPYLYGGKYGPAYMSFGGHWVCLVAADRETGSCLVTDTDQREARPVRLADLERARGARSRAFAPLGEYAWIEPRPADWRFDPDAVARRALASLLANYAESSAWPGAKSGTLVGLSGLGAFPRALETITSIVPDRILDPAYGYMAGSIERNGTGGGAFRAFFRDFLAARAEDCEDPRLREDCAALAPLAAGLDRAAAAIGAARGSGRKAAVAAAEAETAALARSVYEAENALRDAVAAAVGSAEAGGNA